MTNPLAGLLCFELFILLIRSAHMTDKPHRITQSLPVANYRPAIVRAVEWLGDRYLLAKPINAGSSRARRLQGDPV
jgi:hypothetical protein